MADNADIETGSNENSPDPKVQAAGKAPGKGDKQQKDKAKTEHKG